ncbi:MAG TPA: hypothetical protein VES95_08865 [Dermatophilaceae bacterium]|nr:hypothetical protein [Dermatophilaceae bacterium]
MPGPGRRSAAGSHRIPRVVAAVAAGAAATLLALTGAACTADEAARPPGPERLSWAETRLPDSMAPLTLAPVGNALLVGARAPQGAEVRPSLLLLDRADPTRVDRRLPVRPVSPTAYQVRWLAVTTRAGRITAVGGAPAGAHSNTRWSTWAGTLETGVREQPQPFETFGGWGAGAVTALVATPERDLLVGSWAGTTGDDVVTWRQSAERWVRTSPAGTPLASTPSLLTGARGATAWGRGVLVVGSTTSLQPGRVAQRPAGWRAPSTAGPWSRVDLDSGDAAGEAHAAACDSERCLVLGQVGGRLAAWDVNDTGARRLPGMPSWPVGERDLLPPPLLLRSGPVAVVPHDGRAHVLVLGPDAVTDRGGPEAASVASVVATGDRLAVVAADGEERTRLWTTAYRS